MTGVNVYKYWISGNYKEGGVQKHFDFEITATDNLTAMYIASGMVLAQAEEPIILENIHYEVME